MKFPPREGDLSREDLIEAADEAVARHTCAVDVNFKFTCEHCGSRCMFQEPNRLYEEGECHSCEKITKVEYGGFMLAIHPNKPKE